MRVLTILLPLMISLTVAPVAAASCPAGDSRDGMPAGDSRDHMPAGDSRDGVLNGVTAAGDLEIAETVGGHERDLVQLDGVTPFPGPDGRRAYREAIAALAGSAVSITAVGGHTDRNGAIAAHIALTDAGEDLATALLSAGKAIIATRIDPACRAPLQAAETTARTARRGEWAHEPWPLPADGAGIWRLAPDFAIVWGEVLNVGTRPATSYLNFGSGFGHEFTVTVGRALREALGGEAALARLKGHWIEVRGYLEVRHGIVLELESTGAIRPLAEDEKVTFMQQRAIETQVRGPASATSAPVPP